MALFLVGCSTAPVKKDLEDYFAINQVINKRYEDKIFSQLEKKMSKAETPEEIISATGEFQNILRDMSHDYAKFQPKIDEVKVINDKIQTGLKDLDTNIDDITAGVSEEDEDKIMAAFAKFEANVQKVNQAEDAMFALAKKKGLKWQQK